MQVKMDGSALHYASEDFENDREIVLEAVKNKGWAFWYASEDLKNNFEFILEAMKNNGDALCFSSANLWNDITVVIELLPLRPWNDFQWNDPKYVQMILDECNDAEKIYKTIVHFGDKVVSYYIST